MKSSKHFSKIALLMVVTLWAVANAHASTNNLDFTKLDMQLKALITDPHTSDSNLMEAIGHLGRIAEERSFWNDIANNTNYTAQHRARAVTALFRRHEAGEIDVETIGWDIAPATWLTDSWIDKLDPRSFFTPGTRPVMKSISDEDSILRINVLKTGNFIYFRFNHDVSLKTFLSQLKPVPPRETFSPEPEHHDTVTNVPVKLITEMVVDDDYDEWYHGGSPVSPPY